MGREIRMVPPNYKHPVYTAETAPYPNHIGCGCPMYDEPYRQAMDEWIKEYNLWNAGKHQDQQKEYCEEALTREYDTWAGTPPDSKYYRPDWKPEEMTWFQVWETVSEGTPVSPPFATKEELIEHLVKFGDDWDISRGIGGWSRKAAELFVKGEYAPSMVVINGNVMSGVEALAEMDKEKGSK